MKPRDEVNMFDVADLWYVAAYSLKFYTNATAIDMSVLQARGSGRGRERNSSDRQRGGRGDSWVRYSLATAQLVGAANLNLSVGQQRRYTVRMVTTNNNCNKHYYSSNNNNKEAAVQTGSRGNSNKSLEIERKMRHKTEGKKTRWQF